MFATAQGVADEGAARVASDFVLFAASCFAMVIMTVALTYNPKSPVHCRGMVTYAGPMPVYWAMFGGLAVCGLAGIKFNALMGVTPVLFLSTFPAKRLLYWSMHLTVHAPTVNAVEIVFLLNSSFSRSHYRYSVDARMAQALLGAGPTIVGTQSAQALVFVVAAIVSPFPAVTNMAIFVSITTVFHTAFQVRFPATSENATALLAYVCVRLQLTWFAAILAWDGAREKSGRHAFMPWKVYVAKSKVVPLHTTEAQAKQQARAALQGSNHSATTTSSGNSSDETEAVVVFAASASPPAGPPPGATLVQPATSPGRSGARNDDAGLLAAKGSATRVAKGVTAVVVVPEHKIAVQQATAAVKNTNLDRCDGVLEGGYGRLLMKPIAKQLTMTAHTAVMVLAIVGITMMTSGLDIRDTLGKNSHQHAFFDDQDSFYTEVGLPVHVVVDSPIAYWDEGVRGALFHLTEGLRWSSHVPSFPPVDSWFDTYRGFLSANSKPLPTTEDVRAVVNAARAR